MENVNKERGMQLFESKISKAMVGNPNREKLILLRDYYSDQVGVMPINGCYSASVMAESCIKAAQTNTSDNQLMKAALQFYENKNANVNSPTAQDNYDVKKIESNLKKEDDRNKALNAQTKLLNSEIENNYNEQIASSGIIVDKNNDLIAGKVTQIEVIDMIQDWSLKRSATTEGKRSLGFLPANFDASVDKEPEFEMEEPKMALIEENQAGVMELLCPDCHEDKIYSISPDTFSCFNCNNLFHADLNLNDLSDMGEDEEENLEDFDDATVFSGAQETDSRSLLTKRSSGNIKSRGKIEEKASD